MRIQTLLLTLAASASASASTLNARQDEPAPDVPAPIPDVPAPQQPPPPPTPTLDLHACQTALDTLIRSISLIPTPNAPLSAYLATETQGVPDACSWVADAPDSLTGAMSAYSTDVLSYLSANSEHVTRVEECIKTSGTSITRAERVTPYFSMEGCDVTRSAGERVTGTGGGRGGDKVTVSDGSGEGRECCCWKRGYFLRSGGGCWVGGCCAPLRRRKLLG